MRFSNFFRISYTPTPDSKGILATRYGITSING